MTLAHRLNDIVDSTPMHANFLMGLSRLEKSGHEKLLRFKKRLGITDKEFLGHLADEARHAQILRKFANQMGQTEEEVSVITKNYLSKLEVFILRAFQKQGLHDPRACYVLLTLIIERRAEIFYPVYEAILQQNCPQLSVSSIINDEANHLKLMEQELLTIGVPEAMLAECSVYEAELFERYMKQFQAHERHQDLEVAALQPSINFP